MVNTNINSLKKIARLNIEFERFIENLKKNHVNWFERTKLLWTIQLNILFQQFKYYYVQVIVMFTFFSIIYCCSTFNWILSAIGRIGLIKVLHYWDWSVLHNTNCLIPSVNNIIDHRTTKQELLFPNEIYGYDCDVCANIDHISIENDINYIQLQRKYIRRQVPVIIIESVPRITFDKFIEQIKNQSILIQSRICNYASNLLYQYPKTLKEAIDVIPIIETEWFLQWRNCDFNAMKQTRLLWTKPKFWSSNFEPFHDSWILLAVNMKLNYRKFNLLDEQIVTVHQLNGNLAIELRAKGNCNLICTNLQFTLTEGSLLVLPTALWEMYYKLDSNSGSSITFITEVKSTM